MNLELIQFYFSVGFIAIGIIVIGALIKLVSSLLQIPTQHEKRLTVLETEFKSLDKTLCEFQKSVRDDFIEVKTILEKIRNGK